MRSKLNPARSIAVATALFLAAATRLAAQQPVTVSGVVRDASSGRVLSGAIVTLGAPGNERSTRTDETGAFAFSKVAPGTYPLVVKRLGFEPASRSVNAAGGGEPDLVALTRVTTLDTVKIRATNQGIYGAVGTAHGLLPLPAATVQVLGATSRVSVDSFGRFYVPIKSPGAYLVRAVSPGYESQTMSVTVRRDEGVEVALLLDSATTPASHMWEMAYADFSDRMHVRRNSSAIIPRAELTQYGDRQLADAIRRAPSFNKAVLRIGGTACVFVDGQPKPGFSLDAFDATDVEAVEAYTASSEATGNLARRWPR